jgi:4-aminobutyrate aminotransferase
MTTDATASLSPVWSRISDIVVERGEGSCLYDTAGRRYLDFTCGIAVTNTGHCHPKVVAAIQAQAARLIHGQINIIYHQPMLELIRELQTVLPPVLDSFFFSNSGAEAIEGAVKLCKHATGRPNIVVFSGSFHGRTHLTMAMTTSKTVYRVGYQPLVPGIFVAPYPYAYRLGTDETQAAKYAMSELKRLLKSQTAPEETGCVVVEPVLGEGGYVVPPARFMADLRALCDETGILLVADEIQSGIGRTGKFFAVEHFGVVPDVMTMAKGIASGLPLSCVVTRKELAAKWRTGTHGGTFGGNAVACAAGAATLRVIKEEGLVENAAERGGQLTAGLRRLQADFPIIGDVRGLGLMVATEFTSEGQPATAIAKAVVKAAQEAGLLLLTCGTDDNVIRWIPPLVVTGDEIEEALAIFAGALDKTITD